MWPRGFHHEDDLRINGIIQFALLQEVLEWVVQHRWYLRQRCAQVLELFTCPGAVETQ
jgi:hypothetical protein